MKLYLGIILATIFILLIGGVCAYPITWSNPTYQNGSAIDWNKPKPQNIKADCSRHEWNNNFADYRAGLISKKDMIKYIGGCKW